MNLDNDNLRDALERIKAKAESAVASGDGRKALVRAMREIGEIVGAFALAAAVAALAWLFSMATPHQFTGETDRFMAAVAEGGE